MMLAKEGPRLLAEYHEEVFQFAKGRSPPEHLDRITNNLRTALETVKNLNARLGTVLFADPN